MAQLAIFGHATRGKEVIEILEMLGGYNYYNLSGKNGIDTIGYHIGSIISNIVPIRWQNKYKYISFTLETFLKKYPYKVGNKVITYAEGCLAQFTIQDMRWNHKLNKIEYKICSSWLDTSLMLPYKEETVEESIENTNKVIFDTNAQCCDIMNEIIKEETMREKIKSFEIIESHFANEVKIEFDPSKYEMVKRDNGYYVVKKQPQYPKTYEECCALLSLGEDGRLYTKGYKARLIQDFQKLLVCRDAYWKIAGDWKFDFDESYYYLCNEYHKIQKFKGVCDCNAVLAFSTAEMRDAFFENFKELIEICKELL